MVFDLKEIRREMIAALFSDEKLVEHLVLKGGNALELVHQLISRGSVDIDFSISGQFDDIADIRNRIFRALQDRFVMNDLVVFDERFEAVHNIVGPDPIPWWGGYIAEFKLIGRTRYEELAPDLSALQRQAITSDLNQGRVFRIDISKHEFCRGKVPVTLKGQTVFVYSEEMCIFEKYRSLCQQMPQYVATLGREGRARGRDFYDIYTTISRRAIDIALPENLELCRAIFEAKHVPLALIQDIDQTREFHRLDWEATRQSVEGEVFEFDVYFDFVTDEAQKLKALWIE